eukprot:2440173-Prymnesium_polylepis.1
MARVVSAGSTSPVYGRTHRERTEGTERELEAVPVGGWWVQSNVQSARGHAARRSCQEAVAAYSGAVERESCKFSKITRPLR